MKYAGGVDTGGFTSFGLGFHKPCKGGAGAGLVGANRALETHVAVEVRYTIVSGPLLLQSLVLVWQTSTPAKGAFNKAETALVYDGCSCDTNADLSLKPRLPTSTLQSLSQSVLFGSLQAVMYADDPLLLRVTLHDVLPLLWHGHCLFAWLGASNGRLQTQWSCYLGRQSCIPEIPYCNASVG